MKMMVSWSSQEIKSLDLINNPTILLTACNTIDSQYYLFYLTQDLPLVLWKQVLISAFTMECQFQSSSELNQGIFKNNNSYFSESLQNSIIEIKSKENFHTHIIGPYIYLGR